MFTLFHQYGPILQMLSIVKKKKKKRRKKKKKNQSKNNYNNNNNLPTGTNFFCWECLSANSYEHCMDIGKYVGGILN